MEGQAESATQDFSVHAIFSKLGDPVTSISDAIIELRAQIRQADDDALHERQRHGALDPPATSEATNDVLLLNVGGHLMSVSRRHMTQGDGVEGTPLAAPLSGSWDSRLVKDDAQRVFLDMDPEAFKTIHKAILDAETIRSAGKAASVDHLLDDAAKRDYTGTPDFWVRWMMSTLDKTAAEASSSAVQELQVTATHSGAETVDAVMKGVLAEKARLEEQLRDAQRRRAKIDEEIRAVTPFLLPMSGGDAVRSVEVCGQVISTVQSTLDEMGDIALSHRFDLGGGAARPHRPHGRLLSPQAARRVCGLHGCCPQDGRRPRAGGLQHQCGHVRCWCQRRGRPDSHHRNHTLRRATHTPQEK